MDFNILAKNFFIKTIKEAKIRRTSLQPYIDPFVKNEEPVKKNVSIKKCVKK